MGLNKTKKRKKSSRYHGRGMGTCGTGARKNSRDKGNQGGAGKMVGSGKRADQHKTRIINKYGNSYFGTGGVTSRSVKVDKRDRINISTIQGNIERFGKKSGEGYKIDLNNYKILGEGEVKNKLFVRAKSASKSAKEKVENAGGEIILSENKGSKQKEKE